MRIADTPAPVEVQLYRVSLRDDARAIATALRQLSHEEHARAGRFRTAPDHRRYVLTRARLREIVGRYLDLSPRAVPIVIDAQGKPGVDAAARDGVHFNCSHAGDLGVIALASAPVGIDVEQLRPLDDVLDLADAQFAEDERATIRRARSDARTALFLQCWTSKEAVLKATGAGIANGMAHFSVALDRERQHLGLPDLARLDRPTTLEARAAHVALLTLARIAPEPGYVGAVAVAALEINLRWKT